MKIKELIGLLQQEIAETPEFADAEILSSGEETGSLRPVIGFVITASKDIGVYLVTDENDSSEFGEGDDS